MPPQEGTRPHQGDHVQYAGRVIDGPKRGEQIAHYSPWYEVCIPRYQPLFYGMSDPRWDHMDIIADHIVYRWSYSLGEWCMVY